MYREFSKPKQNSKIPWYQKLGYDAAIHLLTTPNSVLASTLKQKFAKSKKRIKFCEEPSLTFVKTLQKSNPNPPPKCSRSDCVLCEQGKTDLKCYKPNIGYRFACNRWPCNSAINMSKLSTRQILSQLSSTTPTYKPALYEGESWRSGYSRSKLHYQSYFAKEPDSCMWIHTRQFHEEQIGGRSDYKFVITGFFTTNKERQTDESWRQKQLQVLQQEGKVMVMNSKIDFIQPLMYQLHVHRGSTNNTPGASADNQYRSQRSKPVRRVRFSTPAQPTQPIGAKMIQVEPTNKPDKQPDCDTNWDNISTISQTGHEGIIVKPNTAKEFERNVLKRRCSTPNPEEGPASPKRLRFDNEFNKNNPED